MNIQSRDQLSKLLPDVLVELVEAYYPCDRDRASPIAPLMHELRFNRTPDHAHPCLLCIMCERPMFRLMGREPWEQHTTIMLLRVKGGRGETREATKARLQNEIEQDRIAKSLEPVVAEHLLQKLPKELEDKIRYGAMERTPTATLISTLSFRQSLPDEIHSDGLGDLPSTVVECGDSARWVLWSAPQRYYLCPVRIGHFCFRRYLHSDFDDLLHPQHFGIGAVLQRLRNKESLIRELPDGWEVSADLGRHPTVRMIQNALWAQRPGRDKRRSNDPRVTTFPHMKYKRETPKCDEVIAKATTARLQNEIEQDRIAKALEPVVAEHLMQKLPKVLEDKIRWWATEPTPTAKIMKDVSILFRVFPHSDYSPFGPGKKCVIHAELWKRGAFFWDPNLPDFVRRCEKTFKIHDIPLDAEPTNNWRHHP